MLPKHRNAALLLAAGASLAVGLAARSQGQAPAAGQCAVDTGITLPPGFCATLFADDVGHARHMAVAADGTVYVNTWSGRYYRNFPPPTGAFLVALRDEDGDGRAEKIERFGPTAEQGGAGGDGIALYKDGLYVEADDRIDRYALTKGQMVPAGKATTVLSGMPVDGSHNMHPFAIDAKGQIFVNSGSASNACQEKDRQLESKGMEPCAELATRAGIWRYDAARTDQTFSPAERYATGIRNTGGISFDAAGRMYAVQHGRDQLWQNWPKLYTMEQGVERPAEELMIVTQSGDFGWPRCYYDGFRKARVLAPEYGGDGGKAVGPCATKGLPTAAFPAHWAPNDVLIHSGKGLPTAYRGGAFIAFHGSWNRAPAPQAGYAISFQPLKDGKASGAPILFADGFSGGFREPGRATHRPAGLAMGPDGALYIADDVKGRIWRVTWHGAASAPLVAAPAAKLAKADDAVNMARALPPGWSAAQVDLGRRIFLGEARSGTCAGCHGSDGKGSSAGPALTGPDWLWTDGSVSAIARIITAGVPEPRKTGGVMPPKGGVDLTDEEVRAVAAYVWTIGK